MGNKGSTTSSVMGRNGEPAKSIFDFDVENIDGKTVPLKDFEGKKVYYVVNVATQ